ncbi:hypothetical protein [Microbispora bryophytorum]|uniref:DUF320 domain-containing protein n=2 Tax=Microbispora bryophytorum TaxID=1460882 RepID=A0A8H9GT78_9ACTN|nr:hypothetical protein [Microbispora bryophytorum]MBD3135308.1 hypothetical protein [Microbispora bryophytorum]GGN96968.1 hypothetical protein GCM10011574_00060 [Microbispora bryophytorum]
MSMSARRMAVAALLIVMPSVAVVPQALAAPVPAAGHGPHGHGGKSGQGGHGGQGKKGQGKKGKGKKGKGHGHGGARLAGFGGGLGDGGGGGTQRTAGVNTANAPTISSPPYQLNTGKRNVNAPAGNSAVDFAGVQQVSSVSVFTDSLSGNCRGGIKNCSINQTLESNESRGEGIGH